MKTLLNEDILDDTLGILYICDYQYPKLNVIKTLQFDDPSIGLHYFCEVPNPESQLAMGDTKETFEKELTELHKHMLNSEWQEKLSECL